VPGGALRCGRASALRPVVILLLGGACFEQQPDGAGWFSMLCSRGGPCSDHKYSHAAIHAPCLSIQPPQDGLLDLSAAPPFGLADIRAAIPDHCWERDTLRSVSYLVRDVALVFGLAAAAYTLNTW
jgi:hypothetical protein